MSEPSDLIDHKLKDWTKARDRLVVGIEGRTGAGKTTLLKDLAEQNPKVTAVHMDDFLVSRSERKLMSTTQSEMVQFWLTVRWYKSSKIREVIEAYHSGKESFTISTYGEQSDEEDRTIAYTFKGRVLVIEGVYLLLPKLADLWDKIIYLDTGEKLASKRKTAREKGKWGDHYIPESDPRSRSRAFKIAYKQYLAEYQPSEQADLVVSV